MAAMSPEVEQFLRYRAFKYLNRFMLLNWRLGVGPYYSIWPPVFGQFLVLVHTGRKTGLQRRTPVNFAEVDGTLYVTAGFGKIAHWYRNIMAQPQIEIWTPGGWWAAEAEDVTGSEGHTALMREVLKGSGFASFAAGINPYTLSDAELDTVTADYRLLRLRRVAPRTGEGGPGDLVWVWPLLVMALLPLAFRRRKRA